MKTKIKIRDRITHTCDFLDKFHGYIKKKNQLGNLTIRPSSNV